MLAYIRFTRLILFTHLSLCTQGFFFKHYINLGLAVIGGVYERPAILTNSWSQLTSHM